MKIAILSRNSRLYSTSRLVEAARARGHRVRVLDPLRCYMRIARNGFALHYGGRALKGFDCVIPRIGASVAFYGTAVLRQLEMMGVYTPSSSDAVLRARDKLRSLQILARHGIDLPVTVFGDNPDDTSDLLNMLGAPPHVIKLNEGAQGNGVVLAEKPAASQSVIEAFRGLYANFLVQEFVREANGCDIRCFVVGEHVAAAMQREAVDGDFRANLHRGGTGSPVRLGTAERRIALRAAKVLGLGIAGVDLVRSARGPLVLEVNASPGLEGIEAVTGVDIADAVVRHLERSTGSTRSGKPQATRGRKRSARAHR
ncbi:MAG TPA: 30S ribosomal protein S6--L-glutamate ligase [Rhodanobacteraceae bacterium]|nr:30S ribosomal protein S6--L-glutamate ligase [Rhodanobacteraceae bacterium]